MPLSVWSGGRGEGCFELLQAWSLVAPRNAELVSGTENSDLISSAQVSKSDLTIVLAEFGENGWVRMEHTGPRAGREDEIATSVRATGSNAEAGTPALMSHSYVSETVSSQSGNSWC
jgi:hypothetical protein